METPSDGRPSWRRARARRALPRLNDSATSLGARKGTLQCARGTPGLFVAPHTGRGDFFSKTLSVARGPRPKPALFPAREKEAVSDPLIPAVADPQGVIASIIGQALTMMPPTVLLAWCPCSAAVTLATMD